MAFLLVYAVVSFSNLRFRHHAKVWRWLSDNFEVFPSIPGLHGARMEFSATTIPFGVIAVAVMEIILFLLPSVIGLNILFLTLLLSNLGFPF
jgi:hypothetical protein